jgi:spore maturation protein CgeE
MINLLKNTEMEYVRCFSKEQKNDYITRFWDENFEDSYANNLTVLHKNVDEETKIQIINKEINERLRDGNRFLLFEVDGDISKEVIKKLRVRPSRIDKLEYMSIETKDYVKIVDREDCIVKEVITEEDYSDIIKISILDYTPLVGKSYSKKRIKRKVDTYKDSDNNLTSFISYIGDEPVGSCELLEYENTAKIEDFGVLENYQNQGVGKSILRQVLKRTYADGFETAYVITENKGIAKEMYKKWGFKKVGEKTQLIFSLKEY